jgi:mono/diheme cytochrome c family protein
MRLLRRTLLVVAASGVIPIALAAYGPQALKNPVAADARSIAAGKQVFDKQCASCHGDHGKGDGPMGEELNPRPADLSDADWKHGSTDGDIFTVVHDGVKNTGMRAFGHKMTAHQMWDVVNYVRSLGPHTH